MHMGGAVTLRWLLLNRNLHGYLTRLLEDQRQRKMVTRSQWLAQFEQHHMMAARLEFHLPVSRYVDGFDLLHAHHVAFVNMGVQFRSFGTRRMRAGQAIGLARGVAQTEVDRAGGSAGRHGAGPYLGDIHRLRLDRKSGG